MIDKLFPVQERLIPIILNKDNSQSIYPNDLCVTAPTGSGKTLTYVLPIVESLKNRLKPCLSALVLVPVSDLADQVYNVFKDNLQNTNLKIALLSTKHQFAKEQETLIDRATNELLVDIIVCTPGRLVDHIQKTVGFDVSNLKYLVIDECDRIMDQIKQNWLPCLYNSINANKRLLLKNENLNVNNLILEKAKLEPMQKLLLSATLTRNPEMLEQIKLFQPRFFNISNSTPAAVEKAATVQIEQQTPLKPALEAKPEAPVAVIISGETTGDLSVPNELTQLFVECTSFDKPLIALYLIKQLKYNNMLIFVKSIDTAKRLCKLLELNKINAVEYSSSLHVERRKRILNKFQANKIDILVCSDLIARGMDLLNVNYVLLYDAPAHLNSYIHRIGRTARAGRNGTSLTLLEHKEVFFFKKMVEKLTQATTIVANGEENNKSEKVMKSSKIVKEMKIEKAKLKPLIDDYKLALEKLKTELNNSSSSSSRSKKRNNNNNIRKRKSSSNNNKSSSKKPKLIENNNK